MPVQGWKLHLSTIPTEARDLLRVVLPSLKQAGFPFKVIFDEDLLSRLNEGALGSTQVGKFATIYPPSDAAGRRLAASLVTLTRGFHGPIVATDLRLGDVLYTRYGGFRPIGVRDRLGRQALYIRDKRGRLLRDEYTVPYKAPPDRRCPFREFHANGRPGPGKLLGPGFLLTDVMKAQPKGCVYRALDLRKQESVALTVLKEGRQWCLADRHGRDIRSRLQHQARLHAALRGSVPIPEAGEYFEAGGHGYLPFAYLRGHTLLQVVQEKLGTRPWRALAAKERKNLLTYLAGTIDVVGAMHRAGYVHRDLSAKNVYIAEEDGRVQLLDLELSYKLKGVEPPFGLGTPGFMSPQQEARRRPSPADDIHALGALTLLVLTGLDPCRLQFAAPGGRSAQWKAVASGVDPRLVEMAVRCLDARPTRRPSLEAMRGIIRASLSHGVGGKRAPRPPRSRVDPAREVRQGLRGLLQGYARDPSTGLWLSEAFDEHERGGSEGSGRYELRRSANRGVAGVLYVLGRLARFGHGSDSEAVVRQARRAARWLMRNAGAPDGGMPGLHFGEAGVAMALTEAIAGGLVPRTPMTERYIRRALSGHLDWPDLTHGAAGQGVAALYCGDRLGDPAIASLASRCAAYLVRTQHRHGYWTWPRLDSMPASHGVLTGFAHGTAGITYFLAEYARRSGDPAAERAWGRAAAWLMKQAEPEGRNALNWPIRAQGSDRWTWWCHGAVGIAILFLRLYEQTREMRFADIAARALRVHPPEFLAANLSQCHGSSGVGEVYLEADRVLGGREWRRRADGVLDTLHHMRRSTRTGGSVWLVENPYIPTADLMVGGGGIVHLLLRAELPRWPIGLPLLLDPL